jgi:hypothetical protein
MSDTVLIDGDKVLFLPTFGAAIVAVMPGTLSGKGAATVGGKKVCIDGDEKDGKGPGCVYFTPVYSIPGSGTLKIQALAGNQKARHTRSDGKPVLLKGGQLEAVFEVQTPAQQPPPGTAPPVPDSTPQYSGKGSFVSTNLKLKGT